jgi:hypothetical protein
MSIIFRLVVSHPFSVIRYGFIDLINYIRHFEWRKMQTGKLIAYTALFGGGKTLSCVHYVVANYEHYNNKRVYDLDRHKWVTQRVHVLSNVDLNIPFERLESLSQIVRVAEQFRQLDEINDTLTCTLVLGDEFSVQMNSRNFKSNIDPLFLNTLLTCRHHHITIVYNAQRFQHVDALLRQVTSYCVECHKIWRFMIQKQYDAYEMEFASDPTLVKPVAKYGWFITDRDYHAFDTLACVGNLKKSIDSGDMESEIEIINRQAVNYDNENITSSSRKLRKLRSFGRKRK